MNLTGGQANIFQTKGQFPFYRSTDELIIRILKNHTDLAVDVPAVRGIGRIQAVDHYPSVRRVDQAIQAARQGTLAGTIGADNAQAVRLCYR